MLDPVGGSVAKNTGSVASAKGVLATGKRKASPSCSKRLLDRTRKKVRGQRSHGSSFCFTDFETSKLMAFASNSRKPKGQNASTSIFWIPWHYLLKPRKKGWEFRQKRHKETESRGHLDLMMMCFKHGFAAFLGNILKSHNQKTWMTKSFCNICLFIHLTSS